MAEAGYGRMAADTRRLQDAFTAVARIPKPVVAAITGRFVGAEEALAIGLVDQVVPDAEVYDAARALVARYARGPALALRAAKQAIDSGLDVDLPSGLEIERLNFAGLFATEDQRTGMRSFVENGPGKATFAGR
jgi:enoyl-CoA hydratase/carnithine racemase